MEANQPSLWDNTALETGFQYLVELRFDQARRQFKDALASQSADTAYIRIGLGACDFWQTGIQSLIDKTKGDNIRREAQELQLQRITHLLTDYKNFSFKQIRNFGNNLLLFLAGRLMLLLENNPREDIGGQTLLPDFFESLELLTDLLMDQKPLRPAAINYLDRAYSKNKQHASLCFLRAEIYARNGFKMEAAQQYVHNFFHFPKGFASHRKLPEFIQKLLGQYGPYWTPVYGAVHQVLPLVKTPENITTCCLEHEQAMCANRLFYEAEFLLRNKDLAGAVLIRKQLKQQYPEFFEHYHNYIHQRETLPSQFNKSS